MHNEDITVFVAVLSILIALSSLLIARKSLINQQLNNARTLELQDKAYQKQLEQFETQYKQNRTADRASCIPFFVLITDKEIYKKGDSLILPITIKNVGKETAINISLRTIHEKGGLDDYFETLNCDKNIHRIYDYLNESYAEAKGEVSFLVECDIHDFPAYDVTFKIQFYDLINRKYQQEFRFQYGLFTIPTMSRNKTTCPAVLIEDIE